MTNFIIELHRTNWYEFVKTMVHLVYLRAQFIPWSVSRESAFHTLSFLPLASLPLAIYSIWLGIRRTQKFHLNYLSLLKRNGSASDFNVVFILNTCPLLLQHYLRNACSTWSNFLTLSLLLNSLRACVIEHLKK